MVGACCRTCSRWPRSGGLYTQRSCLTHCPCGASRQAGCRLQPTLGLPLPSFIVSFICCWPLWQFSHNQDSAIAQIIRARQPGTSQAERQCQCRSLCFIASSNVVGAPASLGATSSTLM